MLNHSFFNQGIKRYTYSVLIGSPSMDIVITHDNGDSYINLGGASSNTDGCVYADSSISYYGVGGGISWGSFYAGSDINEYGCNNWPGITGVYFNCYDAKKNQANSKIYLGQVSSVLVSTNNGESFSSLYDTSTHVNYGVSANGDLIASATNSGVYISPDHGSNVTRYTTSEGLGSNTCRNVVIVGSAIWVATSSGVSKTTDNGSNWTNYTTSDGLINNNSTDIAYDSKNGIIYVVSSDATNGGISWTSDNGANWSNMELTMSKLLNGIFCLDGIVWVIGNGGLAISYNSANSWTYSTSGASSMNFGSIYVTRSANQ
jgi:hypothetical protein